MSSLTLLPTVVCVLDMGARNVVQLIPTGRRYELICIGACSVQLILLRIRYLSFIYYTFIHISAIYLNNFFWLNIQLK